ncbi:MAG TPA: adenylate/guanylate cyclase domain-containing protein, partial [Limnochordia bacterium]|nr:adenylate/guanylate cyclase domain-containing protein [Limnochordia bacterium]
GWLFVRASVWLDVLPVWLAIAGSTLEGAVFRYQIIEWNTRRLKERFERYVSPEVAAQLGSDREIELGGQRRRVSVLFADLRGFTRFAEGLPPERTLAVLNRHLRIMSDAVLQHGGTLDKFTGDGLMAFFGAPLAAHDHASRALRAAAAMLSGIERIDAPRLPIGIGIHTGDVVVGNIGSDRRLEYTAIGDTVNVAARLEEAAEAGEILVSEETHAAGGDLPGWHYRQPESLTLKGRRSPLSCRRLVRDDSGRRHPRESASG